MDEKTGKKNIVPLENMPKMSNLHKIEINVPQLKNKMIYFWATESKNIKKNSGIRKSNQNVIQIMLGIVIVSHN